MSSDRWIGVLERAHTGGLGYKNRVKPESIVRTSDRLKAENRIPEEFKQRSRIPKKQSRGMGRPPLNLAGKVIARLNVLDFISGEGWLVECRFCGLNEVAKNSQRLLTIAVRACASCGREQ